MASVQEPTLLALYGKYKSTLRGVSLHKTTLVSRHDSKINLWTRLCNNMAKSGLELTSLGLHYMKQVVGDGNLKADIVIKESRNKCEKVWKGSAFSHAIKDITDDMQVSWSTRDYDEESDSDEDENGSFYTFPTSLSKVPLVVNRCGTDSELTDVSE
jgi:hypothetical protein